MIIRITVRTFGGCLLGCSSPGVRFLSQIIFNGHSVPTPMIPGPSSQGEYVSVPPCPPKLNGKNKLAGGLQHNTL